MDRGKAIFLNNTLRDQDGILKVVSIPWHKRNAHILTQGELAEINRWSISQHVTT